MIVNRAVGIQAAGTWTRVLTPLANARLVARTVSRDDAFGTTIRGCADIIRHTGTRWVTVDVATLRVGTAGRRYAGVRRRTWQRSG